MGEKETYFYGRSDERLIIFRQVQYKSGLYIEAALLFIKEILFDHI